MAAIHIEDPTKCKAYLDQACGENHDLRNRVDVLLEAHRQAKAKIESSADAAKPGGADEIDETTFMQSITESTGEVIGNYKLLEQIGAGGMGVVYVAEQERPVRRKVALKIIKPGMDSKPVVPRQA